MLKINSGPKHLDLRFLTACDGGISLIRYVKEQAPEASGMLLQNKLYISN